MNEPTVLTASIAYRHDMHEAHLARKHAFEIVTRRLADALLLKALTKPIILMSKTGETQVDNQISQLYHAAIYQPFEDWAKESLVGPMVPFDIKESEVFSMQRLVQVRIPLVDDYKILLVDPAEHQVK